MSTPTGLDPLLALQERDSALDRLRHRRATLPERDARARGEADATALTARRREAEARHGELAREEARLDDEAEVLRAKAAEVEAKMYSGEIASPRELQAMQADVDQLRRHQRTLENRELELMEQREPVDAELAELEAQERALTGELDRLGGVLAGAESALDAELAEEVAAREAIVSVIPPALLAEYERCRARARGVGAARLVGHTCQGCHLTIPATEVERIRRAPAGTVAHCDNCGCILIP